MQIHKNRNQPLIIQILTTAPPFSRIYLPPPRRQSKVSCPGLIYYLNMKKMKIKMRIKWDRARTKNSTYPWFIIPLWAGKWNPIEGNLWLNCRIWELTNLLRHIDKYMCCQLEHLVIAVNQKGRLWMYINIPLNIKNRIKGNSYLLRNRCMLCTSLMIAGFRKKILSSAYILYA